MPELSSFKKDPSAVLDYVWDWTAWLEGDVISSHTVTPADGITVNSSSSTGAAVTVWVSGGTAGQRYLVTCRIVTTGGRTDERTILFVVTQR